MTAGRAAVPALPAGIERVEERRLDGTPLLVHPGWAEAMPWLVQGITGAAEDMSLFGGASAATVLERWQRLRDGLGCLVLVHARQVHAGTVLVHDDVAPGIHLAGDADGHVTARERALIAVSVADCVPVFLVAAGPPVIGLLHAGWRGAAAGILEEGIDLLRTRFDVAPSSLAIHFGPAICGACYEVGQEVIDGLGLAARSEPGAGGERPRVDLRAALALRALAAGVPAERITTSAHCTRCGGSPFFSHRAGSRERQLAVMAIRPGPS